MKSKTFFLLFFLPLFAGAQISTRPDTVITADPDVPGLEHWVIHGYKGLLKMQGSRLEHKKNGVWREYNEGSGMITRLEEYKAGKKHGALLQFASNGTLLTDETYVNDVLQGYRTTYSNGGRVKTSEYYNDGKLNGPRKTYYDNSKIQEEGNWKNGERDGKTTWYLQTGTPSLEYTYKDGTLDGPSVSYDDKGLKKQEGSFRNNLEEGEWRSYSDSTLEKKIYYKEGKVTREVQVKK